MKEHRLFRKTERNSVRNPDLAGERSQKEEDRAMSQPQIDSEAVRLYYLECRSYKKAAEHFSLDVESVKRPR